MLDADGAFKLAHVEGPNGLTCPGLFKIPDPARREEIVEQKQWALIRYEQVKRRRMGQETSKMQALIQRCDTELEEMNLIEAICHTSAQIDEEGRGVKKSALLENQEAHAYCCKHRASSRAAQTRKRTGKAARTSAQAHPLRINPQRDVARARYRYLQMTKPEIVERLLTVEQAYAELADQQAQLQFTWAEQQIGKETMKNAKQS